MQTTYYIDNAKVSLTTLVEAMPVAVALIDREGRHIALNDELASISGLPKAQLVGKKVAELSAESAENIQRDFRFFDQGLDVPAHEIQLGDRVFLVRVKAVRDDQGVAVAELVVLTDISQNKHVEQALASANEQLHHLANHDSLTGLCNVRSFNQQAHHWLSQSSTPCAFLFIDLDHFKQLNDRDGHDAGDRMLQATADCLRRCSRHTDLCGRIGGEEFALFLPDTDLDGALTLAETLRHAIAALRVPWNEHTLTITASIGVAITPPHGQPLRDLQHQADQAMYQAKHQGRNRVSVLTLGSEQRRNDG